MKKIIFSALVGLAFVAFTGCTTGSDAEVVKKCQSSKCDSAKKCQAGKCGDAKKVSKKCDSAKKCASSGKCAK